MAVIYLRSTDGDDASDGSTWALAKLTMAAALTAAGAGGTVYVSQAHAETQASAMTLTSPGTAAAPVIVLCVNDGAEPPTALATTATVATTGANGITWDGFAYIYGLSFLTASGTSSGTFQSGSSSSSYGFVFESCLIKLNTTSAAPSIRLGGIASATSKDRYVKLINTNLQFGNASQAVRPGGNVIWVGGTVAGTAPTTLFLGLASNPFILEVYGVDLSPLGSNNIIDASATMYGSASFRNCKLGTSFVLMANAIPGQGSANVYFDNCDSGDTNYKMSHYKYQGSIVHDATVYENAGASDGTTHISHKMVSLAAGPTFHSPLRGVPITIWNETLAEIGVWIVVAHDSATDLTDAQMWMEVEYLGTSGYPLSLITSTRAASILATPAALPDDTDSTWTGTGGWANPNLQYIYKTFTPEEKGLIRVTPCLALANKTVYVDPHIQTEIV